MREREMGSSSKADAIAVDSSSSSSGGGGATAETDTDTTKQAAVVLDSTGPFSIGDKVLAYHNHCLYQAKVQKVQVPMGQFRYHIHYHGWKKSWDEWVSLDRLLKFTQENLQKQKEINKKHSGEKIAKPGGSPLIRHMNSPVARARKRKNDNIVKEENGELEKPVQIHIPSTLKKRLVDDCEFITHMGKLVKLPRNPNVEDILNKYLSYRSKKDGKTDDTVAEILNGLRCYFDKSFPVMLLYKSERQQYQEAIGVGACPAILYGAEHLLRLFVKLPEILNAANIEEDTLKELQRNLQDILKFLQRNQSAFFKSTYQKQEDFKSIPEEQRK